MLTVHKNRKIYIDVLRICAAFLVVYNHTAGFHYYLNEGSRSLETGLLVFFSVLTKLNVPIFYMISGALLLGKEESYKTLFTKRILRFTAVLFCASIVTYGFYNIHTLSFRGFMIALFSKTATTQYWFLYAYFGFLLILPFLRMIASKMTWREVLLLIGGRLILDTLPRVIEYAAGAYGWEFYWINTSFGLPFSTVDILFYPLIGFYCENKVPSEKIGKWFVWLLGAFLGGALCSTIITCHQGVNSGFTQDYLTTFIWISAPAFYLMAKYVHFMTQKICVMPSFEKAIQTLGSLTLGVYLMDPLFHHFLYFLYNRIYNLVAYSIQPVPFSIAYCFVSMMVCSTVTYLLKKLPIIKNIL